MNKICRFCLKGMEKLNHRNDDVFDVFVCSGCLLPQFDTRFRQIYYPEQSEILATTIHIDEFFVVINYAFNFDTKRTQYTTIYKNVIGFIDNSSDIEPLTYHTSEPICDLDMIIYLPFHDPVSLKKKLQIYALFS